ncbi:MAG TPA: glycosyltransferase [Solirubrobacterales bacterium]
MRIVAILASYNERRFIGGCLDHLHEHGVETYLIDNCSSDETVAIAESRLGQGLIGIEEFPRADVYDWRGLLQRKEELAVELDADWIIHLDPDELRLPPPGFGTLAEALHAVDRQGYNAVNFIEFTFVPTREAPDHDHPEFRQTLQTYYPFCPQFPHQLTAWKTGAAPAPDIASTGGHRVRFPGLRMYPRSFPMKHYLFLGVPHAVEKYVQRRYAPAEVNSGWHGWRARIEEKDLQLPSESELRLARPDDDLDFSNPRKRHFADDLVKGSRPARTGEPASS